MAELQADVLERAGKAGDLVRIDADLWAHFGSAEAVNKALRDVAEGAGAKPR